ncbi:hypothetical protein [Crateriforma conspicua]|uniref:Uncharacterized protein n=1 Tax=Crateriforma conspicua TaxID=2527996 RepID=A0A5C6FWP4_9PLAN|nr:hypothetical protein [Crateriforma conspicua]TWU66764.1 hypothetical protein V7x_23350 [Crateriforma conspicua]
MTNHPQDAEAAAAKEESSPRRGSPFAEQQPVVFAKTRGNTDANTRGGDSSPPLDVGVLPATALGAVAASIAVIPFAAACYWLFPGGGMLVAPLGALLAAMGTVSPRTKTSIVMLLLHLGLFAACFQQTVIAAGI